MSLHALTCITGHPVLLWALGPGFNIWTTNGPSEATQRSIQNQSVLEVLLTCCVPQGPGAGRPRRWWCVSLHCPPLASHPTAEARWSVRSECSPPSSPWLCEVERVTKGHSVRYELSEIPVRCCCQNAWGCVLVRTTHGGGRDSYPKAKGSWNLEEHPRAFSKLHKKFLCDSRHVDLSRR